MNIQPPQMPETDPVKPMAPLTLDLPGDFLDSFPQEWFDKQAKRRQDKDKRATRVLRVIQCQPLQDAGHEKVNDSHRWFEGLTKTLMPTWSWLVANAVCPPRTDWMEVEPDANDAASNALAEAVKEIMWQLLMERGQRFPDQLAQIIHDSGCEFGNVVMPGLERKYDYTRKKWEQQPCLDVFRQEDFVLDGDAKSWQESAICLRVSYSKHTLLKMSKPQQGEGGEPGRGPIFDPEQVAKIIDQGADMADNSESLAQAKAELRSSQEDGDSFVGYKFMGYLDCAEADKAGIDYPVIITSINGVRVQAVPNPVMHREWVLYGSMNGLSGDVYPECKAEFVANCETKINLAKTTSSYARFVKAAGMWQYKTDKPELLRKHGRNVVAAPGAHIPDIFSPLDYRPDLSDVENERLQLIHIAQEYLGISEAAKAGLPAPGTTATAAMGAQQGGATRNAQDAEHYTGPTIELLTILLHQVCNEIEEDQFITTDDGEVVPVSPDDLKNFKGKVRINSLGTSSIAPWQQQTVFTALQSWAGIPGYDPYEAGALVGRVLGLPEHLYRKVVPLPVAPVADPMAQMAQGGAPIDASPVVADVPSQAMASAPGPEGSVMAMEAAL